MYTYEFAIPLEELIELLRSGEFKLVGRLLADPETAWMIQPEDGGEGEPLGGDDPHEDGGDPDPEPQEQRRPPLIEGTDQDDQIDGQSVGAEIRAFGGNDVVDGGLGEDTILGGTGNDFLYGDRDDDTIVGGEDNDVIYGGDQGDLLIGDNGSDRFTFVGLGYDDGHEGNDTITAGQGDDRIDAGHGDDIVGGDGDADEVYAGPGEDVVVSRMDGNSHHSTTTAFAKVRNGSDTLHLGGDDEGGDGVSDTLLITGDTYDPWGDTIDFGHDKLYGFVSGVDSVVAAYNETGSFGVSLSGLRFVNDGADDVARFDITFTDYFGSSWGAGTLDIVGFEPGDTLVPEPETMM